MNLARPSDHDILDAVASRSGLPTYVLRNTLAMKGWRFVKTPWVRRQLHRLAKAGYVARDEKAEYGQHHCWRTVGHQSSTPPA